MNISENITKFTDLENNDSLSSFRGHLSQQNHGAYEVFYEFIKEIKPKRILEIGTALGGFTQFLKLIIDDLGLNTKILSYDITSRPWYDDMRLSGIDVRVENIFSDDWGEMRIEVINYIQQDGICIVLCDGGNKVEEFNLISNYIKSGDFILAHDYAENKTTFDDKINGKIWNWHEIQDSDIQTACSKNNLISYKKEIFDNIVWVCKIKK